MKFSRPRDRLECRLQAGLYLQGLHGGFLWKSRLQRETPNSKLIILILEGGNRDYEV